MENIKKRIRLSPSTKIILGFLGIILLGAFLLSLPISNNNGLWFNFFDSLFTSTSAVCVTGLTVVDIATQFNLFGQIILLLLIQLGGLGIVAITSLIFLILGKKINLSSRLTIQESLNKDTLQGVVKFIKKSIIITFIIEGIGALLLLYSTTTYFGHFGKGLFGAIFLSVSAFCNAGFDILGNEQAQFLSLSNFTSDILMLLPIMFLVVLGGIGFVVLIDGFKNIKTKQHTKIVLWITGILIILGTVLFLIFEWNNNDTIGSMSFGEKILNALFQSVSPRTAGFASIDQSALTNGSTITTIFLMLIGGSPNSTAGGIKTTTFFVLLLFLFKTSNENNDIVYRDRKLSVKIISKALKIVLYTLISLIIACCLIRIIEPNSISLGAIIFECTSAICTVGLSTGITPTLAFGSKLILILLMFIGRVGMATIALIVSSKHHTNNNIEYTNTDIIIG